MKTHWRLGMLIVLAVSALAVVNPFMSTACAQEEVLTRGPIHEAFAEMVLLSPEAGIVVAVEPPQAIEEVPPDEMPTAANVIWIPGYWAWDNDRNDFIWVSGVWRIPPPGRTWVPGYWNQVQEGWQWISGFWAPAETEEVEYLPPVPATLDMGPSSPWPGNDQIWVPGCWQWREGGWFSRGRYVWGPGYWGAVRPDWVWVPAHYAWTPRGCIFVDGYWDYAPEARGVLFAPVYFPRDMYAQRTFRYRPTVCIDIGAIFNSLFCRPQYGHYYFGDYYDSGYARSGIYPWFERSREHAWYSPFCEYAAWHHERERPRWREEVRRDFDDRREHRELRPAHTYLELQIQIGRLPERDRERYAYAAPLNVYATASRTPLHLERLSADVQVRYAEQGRERRKLTVERAHMESSMAIPGRGKEFKPSKMRLPKTARVQAVSVPDAPRARPAEQPAPTVGAEPRGKAQGKRETNGRQELPPAAPAQKTEGRREITGRPELPPAPPAQKTEGKRETKGRQEPPPAAPAQKTEGKRETKGRQEPPPAAPVRQAAPPQPVRSEGVAPEGTPSGRRDSNRETKGRPELPPAPPAQKTEGKRETKGRPELPPAAPAQKTEGKRETKGRQDLPPAAPAQKTEGKQETKGRQEPPPAPREQKTEGKRETKGQELPPAPPEQKTDGKQNEESKDKQKDDSEHERRKGR